MTSFMNVSNSTPMQAQEQWLNKFNWNLSKKTEARQWKFNDLIQITILKRRSLVDGLVQGQNDGKINNLFIER